MDVIFILIIIFTIITYGFIFVESVFNKNIKAAIFTIVMFLFYNFFLFHYII